MKFTVERDTLKEALSRALKGVDTNSTLPILSGTLVTAAAGFLQLENTNMDVSIRQNVMANIEEPGQTVIPTHLLNDIVSHLPTAAINFSLEKTVLTISCDKSFYRIKTLNPKEFPSFPNYTVEDRIVLNAGILANMVNRVSVASSSDRNRAILNGIFMDITSERIKLATTDTVRLAVAETISPSEIAQDFKVIAPSKVLRNVLSLIPADQTVTISTNQSQLIFQFGDVVYVTRRIEGTYPNYQKLIPASNSCAVELKMNDLYEAMQRVKAMTISNTEITFQIDTEMGTLVITSNVPDQGTAREEIPVSAEGDSLSISFNSRFIYDCVMKTDDDADIRFEAESPFKPGVFKTKGKDSGSFDFLYLVMPVRPNY